MSSAPEEDFKGFDDFELFCRGLERLTGAQLGYYKRHQMERRARGLAARANCNDLHEYIGLLRNDAEQLEAFMARMTITVSQLWRNPEIFQVLGDQLLPELAANKPFARLRLWCAGCSYGAEPYTLASVCIEHASEIGKAPLIVASDINAQMIAHAKAGVFSSDDARDAPEGLMERHFHQLEDGSWEANDALKALIRFRREDLLKTAHVPMDLIMCRNVAIHFKPEQRDRLHAHLANTLVPGGIFVLGNTEMIARPRELGLERVQPFIFRRTRDGRSLAQAATAERADDDLDTDPDDLDTAGTDLRDD